MKAKQSYRILIKSNLFLAFFSMMACQNPTSINEEDIIFMEVINKDMATFKRYDSINYSKDEYYSKAFRLCNTADRIVEAIKNNNLSKDSIELFNNTLNEYCRTTSFSVDYKKFDGSDKVLMINKIRSYQAIATNTLLNIYKNNYFPMEWVMPIAVPRKNEIKLGEKFIVDFYLAGGSKTNKYIVKVNDSIIDYEKDAVCTTYQEEPLSKGDKVVNGIIQIYHAGLNKTFKYDVSTKYQVR